MYAIYLAQKNTKTASLFIPLFRLIFMLLLEHKNEQVHAIFPFPSLTHSFSILLCRFYVLLLYRRMELLILCCLEIFLNKNKNTSRDEYKNSYIYKSKKAEGFLSRTNLTRILYSFKRLSRGTFFHHSEEIGEMNKKKSSKSDEWSCNVLRKQENLNETFYSASLNCRNEKIFIFNVSTASSFPLGDQASTLNDCTVQENFLLPILSSSHPSRFGKCFQIFLCSFYVWRKGRNFPQ